jgi:hypothetical protein
MCAVPAAGHTPCTLEERRESDRRRDAAARRNKATRVDRRRYAVIIQKYWRGFHVRDTALAQREQHAYLAVMYSCMKIQRKFRIFMFMKREREVLERGERLHLWAAWVVQTVTTQDTLN